MLFKQKKTRVVSYKVDKLGERISEKFEVCSDTTKPKAKKETK